MFRKMRRFKQLLPMEENERILTERQTGILGCFGDEGYPYTVPVNYVYSDGRIFFHCAKDGHKIDAIKANPKVSFCVIERDDVDHELHTTRYRSVILFGKARIIEDDEERRQRAYEFGLKYMPTPESVDKEIRKDWNSLCVVEITIDHMTGKENRELAAARLKGQAEDR